MAARMMAGFVTAVLAVGTAQGQLPGQLPTPEPEVWEPTSTTAMAITGRVTLAPDRITFGNRASLPLEPAGEVTGFLADGQRVTATLYRVTEPGNPVLLRGSRLCSNGRPIRAIAVWQPPPIGNAPPRQDRSLAAFSGTAPPKGADDPDSCGTFQYELPAPPRGRR